MSGQLQTTGVWDECFALECENCGSASLPSRPDGLYEDEQMIECEYCGAINSISVDEDGDAWVSSHHPQPPMDIH